MVNVVPLVVVVIVMKGAPLSMPLYRRGLGFVVGRLSIHDDNLRKTSFEGWDYDRIKLIDVGHSHCLSLDDALFLYYHTFSPFDTSFSCLHSRVQNDPESYETSSSTLENDG
jgi:hypothetical protein